MNIGSGEAAEQLVRMMLSSGEMVIRVSGSALRNSAAMIYALAKKGYQVNGKTSLTKLLRTSRDIQVCPMSAEQFALFRKEAKRLKIQYATIRPKGELNQVDVVFAGSELSRVSYVLEQIHKQRPNVSQPQTAEPEQPPKKESRSEQGLSERSGNLADTKGGRRSTEQRKRPSLELRLRALKENQSEPKTPEKVRKKSKDHVK